MLSRRSAFVPSLTASVLRRATTAAAASSSSASPVNVDRLTDRSAALTWTAPHPAPAHYTVTYQAVGSAHPSLRAVAHPFVHLRNLRPGLSYSASISSTSSFQTDVTFTTTGVPLTATTASAAEAGGATDAATAAGANDDAPLTELSRLEIRVGRIVEVARHPDADTLYVEKVDVGEEEPRTIVSGLVKFVSEDALVGRSVVVLCNLKPRAMRGVTSHGMLLCASSDDHSNVDPLAAPEGAPIGELVTFQGHKVAPIDPGNRASKAFDRIALGLKTDSDGLAYFEESPFTTSAGTCFSPEKLEGPVS